MNTHKPSPLLCVLYQCGRAQKSHAEEEGMEGDYELSNLDDRWKMAH